jgi:hypothetical protein
VVDRDEDDEEAEEVVVVGWIVALVLSVVFGKSVLKWTRKSEPLAEVSLCAPLSPCANACQHFLVLSPKSGQAPQNPTAV